MKKNYKNLITFILFIVLLITSIWAANNILRYKTELSGNLGFRKTEFLTSNEQQDVLFIGASGVFAGFSPYVLYENYGIYSYNLSASTQPPMLSYLNLKEAILNDKTPEVLIIEFISLHKKSEISKYEVWYLNGYADIQNPDLKKEFKNYIKKDFPKYNLLNINFPLYKYHSRWKELTKDDFIVPEKLDNNKFLLGSYTSTNIKDVQFSSDYFKPKDITIEYEASSKYYYDKIIELCKENNIEIIMVIPPRITETLEKEQLHLDYAKEHGIKHFINFSNPALLSELNIDAQTDFYNDTHVNISGQHKLSNYIGNYLVENFSDTLTIHTEKSNLYENYRNQYNMQYQLYEENLEKLEADTH
ncbi:MAG TPA: hypothetical protein GXZ43_00770 [Clostridiaceae bacterium]|nr:hypothetical protein [Clostridiaceae bacterium]